MRWITFYEQEGINLQLLMDGTSNCSHCSRDTDVYSIEGESDSCFYCLEEEVNENESLTIRERNV